MKNEKLIEEYISKNKLDIEKVVDDYYNYITTIIKNSYNFKPEDEDEMISDVFLIIWKNRDKLRLKEKFSPYIAGITKKVIYRKYKEFRQNIEFSEYEENMVSNFNIDKVIEEKETLVKNNKDLVKDKQELQAKIDSAKDYFELDENEKEIVDAKIEEVNNATEEQLAEEQHQFELQVERDKVSVYVDLINNKSYADMSDDGKAKVDEFINEKFAEIPDELKPEYQPVYDKAVQSKAEYEAKIEEEKRQAEEAKRQEEAKKDSHIGETLTFTTSDYSGVVGEWTLTINNVYKTDERNQFEDPINQVVIIEYTVENISIPSDDFYLSLEHEGEFYNSDGYKVCSYPGGDSVYDLAEGMKANGTAYIGINNDTPYLEMHFGGMTYKWTF